MKGLTSDSELHAFVLEPRIVFDADVAATTDVVSDNSDSSPTTDTTTETTSPAVTDNSASDNTPPTLTSEQNTIKGTDYSRYVFDENYTNLASGIDELILSSDGKFAYSVSYSSSLVGVFSVDDDGSLSFVQSVYGTKVDGLSGASQITFSADQSSVYVYSETDNSVVTFSRDSDSGQITYQSVQDVSGFVGSANVADLQENNGYLYLSADSRIYALQKGDDGSLSVLATYTDDENGVDGISSNNKLSFSEDGSLLFVASSGNDSVMSVFSVNSDGTLTFFQAVSGTSDTTYYINSIATSSDGSDVFVFHRGTDDNTQIIAMHRDEQGDYQITDTYDVSNDVTSLMMSSDDSALFTFGSSVSSYSITSDHTLSDGVPMDADEAKISRYSVNSLAYSAESNHIVAVSASALSVFNYESPSADYTEGGEAVAVLPYGVIADSELDALDNYQGASIAVSRAESTDSDSYTFLDANNLTLHDGQIELNGEAIATWSSSSEGVTVSFTASVSQATAQQVLRQIAYENTSDDPDANGASVAVDIVIHDGSGSEASLETTLHLTDVNDAPVLSSTPVSDQYTSGDEYISLFSGTSIDTVEAGQSIWKVFLTVRGSTDDDVLNVDGHVFSLATTGSPKTTESGFLYQIMEDDGVKTVVLFVSSSPEEVGELIDTIQYRNSTLDASGERTFELAVYETGVSENATSNIGATSTVNVTAQTKDNAQSIITGDATPASYTENSGEQAFLGSVSISDTEMDARNEGHGNYDGATLTISLGSDNPGGELSFADSDAYTYKDDQILKDGAVIATVVATRSEMKITFTEAYKHVPTTEEVNAVVKLINYTNTAEALPDSSHIDVSLTDNFGETSEPYAVTINNVNLNDNPELSLGLLYELGVLKDVTSTDDLTDITSASDALITDSGERLFIVDDTGNIAVYQVDPDSGELSFLALNSSGVGATAIDTVVANSDGSLLYVVTNQPDQFGTMYSEITVYAVGEEGTLTQSQVAPLDTVSTNYAISYHTISDLTISDDGNYLFFIAGRDFYALAKDSASGELNVGELLSFRSQWTEPYMYKPTAITISSQYVFVTTNYSDPTLIAYEMKDSGIEWVGYIRNGSTDSDGHAVSVSGSIMDLETSDDGQYVYAATDSGMTVYHFDSDSKVFTQVSSVDVSGVRDIAVSNDGKGVYVTTSEKELIRYAFTDNSLTQLDSAQLNSGEASLRVTDQGNVLVGDHDYTLYQSEPLVVYVGLGDSALLMPTVALSDPDNDLTNDYSGFTLSLSSMDGTASPGDLSIDSEAGFTATDGVISLQGESVATFSVDDSTLSITVTGHLTKAQVEQLLQNVRYSTGSLSEGGEVSFTLTAKDPDNATVSQTVSLDVVETPVANLDGVALSDGKAGASYRQSLSENIVVDPGSRALSWDVRGLPEGVKFDAASLSLSGTPAESGEYTISFTVTNSGGQNVAFDLSLSVALSDEEATPVAHYSDPGIGLEEDQSFSYTFSSGTVTDPQDLALTWQVQGLPEGVSFDAETLTLSGLVEQSGDYDLTVSVTNSLGLVSSFNFVLSVAQDIQTEPTVNILQQRLSDSPVMALSEGAMNAPANNRFASSVSPVTDNGLSAGLSDASSGTVVTSYSQLNHWLNELRHPSDVATVIQTPDTAGNTVEFDLPDELNQEGMQVLGVVLSDGKPLPEGVHFNSHNGDISIDSGLLHQLGKVSLSVTVQDASGGTKTIDVDLTDQAQDSASSDAETSNLEQQAKQASLRALDIQSQALLAELMMS